jgi:alkylation response protein AidB-like acyl-CoA dehydrogenase
MTTHLARMDAVVRAGETVNPRHTSADSIETLGVKLERDRLTRRARRLTAFIAALRQQADDPRARNQHIRRAITEFEAEVAATNARLTDLAAGTTPARNGRDPSRDWRTP